MLIHTRRTPTHGQSQRRTFVARANCHHHNTESCSPPRVERGGLTGADEAAGPNPSHRAGTEQPEAAEREEEQQPEGGPR